jgi:hypothetical protein
MAVMSPFACNSFGSGAHARLLRPAKMISCLSTPGTSVRCDAEASCNI